MTFFVRFFFVGFGASGIVLLLFVLPNSSAQTWVIIAREQSGIFVFVFLQLSCILQRV